MAVSLQRPVILISGSTASSESVQAAAKRVLASGATPLVVTDHLKYLGGEDAGQAMLQAKADMARVDGIIVMGNNGDIDPGDYRAAQKHAKTQSERDKPEGRARAAYEYALIQETLKAKKPFFGICGGMQRLNVLLGGDLHQHVPDLTGDNSHSQKDLGISPYIPVEFIELTPGTSLAAAGQGVPGVFAPLHGELLPEGTIMDNSMHHQAVDRVGQGLRVAAQSIELGKDVRVTEAIEADPNGPLRDQFVLGVQWHPEFGDSPLSVRLFDQMAAKSQEYAQTHPRGWAARIKAEQTMQIGAGR